MPRALWPLQNGQPAVQMELQNQITGVSASRILLADTGAGSQHEPVDLVLGTEDGALFARRFQGRVVSGGAIPGHFEVFTVTIAIRDLSMVRRVNAMIVPIETLPAGFAGIATIRFLDSFTYGNFGQRGHFGLEVP